MLCPLEVVEQLSRREVAEVNDLQEVEEEQPVLTAEEAACEAAEYLRCTYPPLRHGPRSCRCHSTGELAILLMVSYTGKDHIRLHHHRPVALLLAEEQVVVHEAHLSICG